MAMWLDYKPTRYEGKGFLRNLNIRIHRGITGVRWGLGWVFFLTYLLIRLNSLFARSVSRFFNPISIIQSSLLLIFIRKHIHQNQEAIIVTS